MRKFRIIVTILCTALSTTLLFGEMVELSSVGSVKFDLSGVIAKVGTTVTSPEDINIAGVVVRDLYIKADTSVVGNKIKPENAELNGIIEYFDTPVKVRLVREEQSDGKYGRSIQAVIPGKRETSDEEKPWSIGKAIPALADKPFGSVTIDQLAIAITTFEYEMELTRRGKEVEQKVIPKVNLFGDIGKFSLSSVIPSLAGTKLDKIQVVESSFSIQNIQTLKQLKTKAPDIELRSLVDFSALDSFPIKVKTLETTVTISQTKVAIEADLPAGTTIEKIGTVSNGKLNIELDFEEDTGLKKAPTGVKVSITGRFALTEVGGIETTGIVIFKKEKLTETTVKQALKDIRPKDFLFIGFVSGTTPADATLSKIPNFTLSADMKEFLGKIPKAAVVIAYTKEGLDRDQIDELVESLKLTYQEQAAVGGAFEKLTPGFNVGVLLSALTLSDFFPAEVRNNPLMKDIAINAALLTVQKIDGTKQVPTAKLQGLVTLKNLPLLPDLEKRPFVAVFEKDKTSSFDIDLGEEITIRELDLTIKDPKLSIQVELDEKPVQFAFLVAGSTAKEIPKIGVTLDTEISLKITDKSISIQGKVNKPSSIQPFAKTSLEKYKGATVEDLSLHGKVKLTGPITQKKKPEVEKVTWGIDGKATLEAINLTGQVTIEVIQYVTPKKKPIFYLKVQPGGWDLTKIAPSLEGSALAKMDLTGTGLIITSEAIEDPDIGDLKPGVSLYGSYKTAPSLKENSIKGLFPSLGDSPFTNVAIKDIAFIIKDLSKGEQPKLDLEGVFDFTSIKVPHIKKNLAAIKGTLTYSKEDGLRITARIDDKLDVTSNKYFTSSLENPNLVLEVFPSEKDPKKYEYSMSLQVDGSVELPKLGKFDGAAQFDFTNKELKQTFMLKKEFSYKGIAISDARVEFIESKEKSGFEITGRTTLTSYKGTDVTFTFDKPMRLDSTFSFYRLAKNKKADYQVMYDGKLADATLEPFKQIKELNGIGEYADLKLNDAHFGLVLTKKSQNGYVYGDFSLKGVPLRGGVYILRTSGKTGFAIMGQATNKNVTLEKMQATFIPEQLRNIYNTALPPVKKVWKALPATTVGVGITNIKYTFYLEGNELVPYETDDSSPLVLNRGAFITGITNPKPFFDEIEKAGTVHVFGKKISLYDVSHLARAFTPEILFLMTFGTSRSELSARFITTDKELQYDVGKQYKVTPGPFMIEFNLTPELELALGVTMTTPDGTPLSFSGGAAIAFKPETVALLLNFSLSMIGIWDKPFGYNVRFGNTAAQIAFNLTQEAVKDAALEVGGGVASTVSAGGGSAAATAGTTIKVSVSEGGFASTLGFEDKEGSIAFNLSAASPLDFLFLARLWGSYGTKDIVRLIPHAKDLGQFMVKTYGFMKKQVPPAATAAKIEKALEIPKSERGKLYGSSVKSDKIGAIQGAMNNVTSKITKDALSIEKAADILAKFSAKAGPEYLNAVEKFLLWADITAENMEVRYAADVVRVGQLVFDRGIAVRGTLKIKSFIAEIDSTLDIDGIGIKGYITPVDFGVISGVSKFVPAAKDQIVITGAGPNGDYNKEPNGPTFNLQLKFLEKPFFTMNGKITVKPMDFEAEGYIKASVDDGFTAYLKQNFFGFGKSDYEFRAGKIDDKWNMVGRVKLSEDAQKRFLQLLVTGLKTGTDVSGAAVSVAQKAVDKIEKVAKPLEAKKATLEKELAETNAKLEKDKAEEKARLESELTSLTSQKNTLLGKLKG